jgi:hypothetical protein
MKHKTNRGYMTVWHVTHKSNINSILETGLDPLKASTEIKRVWLVRWWGLAWAFFHISIQKHIPTWELVAFRVKVHASSLTRFNGHKYTCKRVIYAREYWRADQVLSAIERQREYKRRSYRPEPVAARVGNDLDWLKD